MQGCSDWICPADVPLMMLLKDGLRGGGEHLDPLQPHSWQSSACLGLQPEFYPQEELPQVVKSV